jgi:NCS1 family nucleobase:cation symporter-1
MICDYYLIRRRRLVTADLFRHAGQYRGWRGFNLRALIALACALAPNLPGFLHSVGLVSRVAPVFDTIFTGAWFVGFFVAGAVYTTLAHGSVATSDA